MIPIFAVKAITMFVIDPALVFVCGRIMRWYALHARERSVVAGLAIALPPLIFAISIFYGLSAGAELASLLALAPAVKWPLGLFLTLLSIGVNVIAFIYGIGEHEKPSF